MAVTPWIDALVTVNSVELKTRSNEVQIGNAIEMKDKSAFGGTARIHVGGLFTHDLTIKFLEDYASSMVNQTLWPLFIGKTEFTVAVRMTSGAISATNPEYTGTFAIENYPQGAALGELIETSVVFKLAADDYERVVTP